MKVRGFFMRKNLVLLKTFAKNGKSFQYGVLSINFCLADIRRKRLNCGPKNTRQ